MAKRKMATAGRGEKAVLARQEVAKSGYGRSQTAARSTARGGDESFLRDILAVFTFLGSIGLLCALATYRRDDALAAHVGNLVGPLGHKAALRLFGTFGVCAYLVPAALFYTSLALFVRGRGRHRGRQIVALVFLALSGAVLGHLLIGNSSGLDYPPGGAIGAALGESLRALLSTFGSVLVTAAAACAALIVATDAAFTRLCVSVGRAVGNFGVQAWTFALVEGKRQLELHKERRIEHEKERLEEEAAFAQELADAEASEAAGESLIPAPISPNRSLPPPLAASAVSAKRQEIAEEEEQELPGPHASEEELDASDADSIAEEASRLARESEERRLKEDAEAKARAAAVKAAKRARKNQDDPAWAAPLAAAAPAATQGAAAPIAAAPVAPAPAPVLEAPLAAAPRPQPVLSIPVAPSAPTVTAPSADPIATAAAAAAVAAVLAAKVEAPSALAMAAAAAANPEPKGGPINALPKLPLIIEPKAPPKPVKVVPEKRDPFAFEGASTFTLPPISLLEMDEKQKKVLDKEVFFATAEKLREKLASFGIDGVVKEIRPGPVVTMYEFEPAAGVKISKIASLSDDLAMAMEAMRVRIVAPIPGKGVVGIEVPNKEREGVFLKEIVEQEAFLKSASKLTMAIGKNIEGMPYLCDLAKMPHVLIAGTTGSGKSVSVNAMIMSLLLKSTPEEVRFIMVDPKVTELSIYEGIPHLLLPVVTDPHKAALALRWGVEEMERRYQLLADAGVRNIAGYNKFVERIDEEAARGDALAAEGGEGSDKQAVIEKVTVEKVTASGRKLRIIDVAEGESEEEALARANGAPTLGVAAPTHDDDVLEVKAEAVEEIVIDKAEERAAEEEGKQFEREKALEARKQEILAEKEKPRKLPYIVIIIDEVADLMMVASREVETYVARLAQMARAAGIHLMIATQRPSTDVITGVIKANFPSRISFALRSKPDSMTILGTVGAEALLGMGDMLILPPTSSHLERVHGAYVSDGEINRVVAHLKAQGKPVYDESILKPRDEEGGEEGGGDVEEYADEAYDQCLALVSEMRQVSVSMLQRKLRLGYNRAARIIERMEKEGVVGPANGSKPRDVLIRALGEMHKEANL